MKELCPAVCFCAAALSLVAQAAERSVWDGVYTVEQARRGQQLSGEECARCHSESLAGGENAPGLVGPAFLQRWGNTGLGELFEKMRSTMPTDSPGRLSRQQYADILAYILNANKLPTGAAELSRDATELNQIRIESTKR